MLDVTLLGEPTTVLSTLGTAIVFVSAVAAASISGQDKSAVPPPVPVETRGPTLLRF